MEFEQKSALQFGATHALGSIEEATDFVRNLSRGVMADAVALVHR